MGKITKAIKQGESDETKAKMFLISKGYPIDTNGRVPTYKEMYNIIKEAIEKENNEKLEERLDKMIEADLSWLKKQGEQKLAIEMKSAEESLGIDSNTYNEIVDECIYGEQKPTDKVGPKFKVGDWITNGAAKPAQISSIKDGLYFTHNDTLGGDIESIDKEYHLWAIKDARDGDILVNDEGKPFIFKGLLDEKHPGYPVAYGGVCINCYGIDEFCISVRCYWCNSIGVKPATQEQRNLLFKKMKDAGYEWDAEKKELKKQEIAEIPFGAKDSELQEITYCIPKGFHAVLDGNKVVIKKGEQKSAWSEEDERIYKSITYSFANNYPLTIQQQEFVKSLKSRKLCVYNPYKAVVESIAKMCDKYENCMCDEEEAKDFLANVAVKCREAAEYNKKYMEE